MSVHPTSPPGEPQPVPDRTVPHSPIRWVRVTWDQLSGLHIVEPDPQDRDAAYGEHDEYGLDTLLSYRARGVLTTLLLMEPGAAAAAEQLAEYGKEGREAIRRAIAELAAGGYLRRELRVPGNGRTTNGITVSALAHPGWQSTYPNATPTYVHPDGSWANTKPVAVAA